MVGPLSAVLVGLLLLLALVDTTRITDVRLVAIGFLGARRALPTART
jgi:hypothetical protein